MLSILSLAAVMKDTTNNVNKSQYTTPTPINPVIDNKHFFISKMHSVKINTNNNTVQIYTGRCKYSAMAIAIKVTTAIVAKCFEINGLFLRLSNF